MRAMKLDKKTTLLDRINWILQSRDLTQEQLSYKSGFSHRAHLSVILSRLRKDPEYAHKMSVEALEKIAKGGNVSFMWLKTGEGAPDARPAAPYAAMHWPNLAVCLNREGSRWSEYTVAAAQALPLKADPSELEWESILDRLEKRLTAEFAAIEARQK